MIQAATLGIVDFKEADPRSRAWWTKLRIILDQLEDFNLARFYRLHYDYDLALLGRTDLTERGYEAANKQAEGRLYKIANIYRPWEPLDPTTTRKETAAALGKAWRAAWGDPASPEVQAAIRETVRMLGRLDVGARN